MSTQEQERGSASELTQLLSADYKQKYMLLSAQHVREIEECEQLLALIRDDLRMRSDDGVVNISNFIWQRLEEWLSR